MQLNIVSVVILTYGHEKYIRQAIDSVLMQKANFNFEIIIGEDKSPDNTINILLEYKNRYPKKIVIVQHETNVGATKNTFDCFERCKGKYITILEGDDYWTDSFKLQKQVDFLENHPEYIGVSHMVQGIDIEGNLIGSYDWKNIVGHIDMNNYLRGKTYSNNACLYRNIFLDSQYDIIYKVHRMIGEQTIGMLLLNKGDIYTLNERMSVYLIRNSLTESNYNSLNNKIQQYKDRMHVFKELENYFEHKYSFKYRNVSYSFSYFLSSIKENWVKEFFLIFKELSIQSRIQFWIMLPVNLVKTLSKKMITDK